MTTTNSRPEWAEVSRSALSLELWAIGQEYKAEGELWHRHPGWISINRAVTQLLAISYLVAGSSSYVAEAEAYLKAARTMLPKIQTSRELHTLGASQ
jgi:hypothetical protein